MGRQEADDRLQANSIIHGDALEVLRGMPGGQRKEIAR